MAKVYLSPSNQTDNRYAYGNTTEAVQCGKIADACRAALERSGVTVKVGHMPSMQDKCKESNAFGADLHVPIHTNAFNGTVGGTRMFCFNSSGEGMKACKAIFNRLAPVTPGTSENIRVDASLYEVRVPAPPRPISSASSTTTPPPPSGSWSIRLTSARPLPGESATTSA